MDEVTRKLHLLDNSNPIAVICHSGIRSAKIAEILITHSFEEVANIEGGINEWSQTVDQSIPQY
jgi:rhodanese-related sulfurtransferase